MEQDAIEKDGGAKSRKLWFSGATSALVIIASLFVPSAVFGEVVTGLITVCGIYVGGNAATRWITLTKTQKAPTPAKPKKEAPILEREEE